MEARSPAHKMQPPAQHTIYAAWIAVLTALDSATEGVPDGVSFGQRYASIYGGIRAQCAMWFVAVVDTVEKMHCQLQRDRDH